MCTLSWLLNNDGYEVFFNRDEQHSRAQAIAPSLQHNTGVIMPLDPQGQGSWIGSNLQGNTICLLNNYQKQASAGLQKNFISRGRLIPKLLQLDDLSDIEYLLHKLNLKQYQAFFLCVFADDLSATNGAPALFQWDGKKLTREENRHPVVSSSVKADEVIKARSDAFNQILSISDTPENHLKCHRSHLPEKGYLSVCMHRDDAQTQSLCHISVDSEVRFRYLDGAPCENNDWVEVVHAKNKLLMSA